MFTRTAQQDLWFIAGSFAQCRIYAKYLGLQIKACEVGLLPRVRAASDAPGMRCLANTNNPTELPARSA
jgi:putative flavoprotein involved in K+ transport